MTLMDVLGFDATDLNANQHGRLSIRQQTALLDCLIHDAAHVAQTALQVRRLTGLVMPANAQPHFSESGGSQLTVCGIPVSLWLTQDSARDAIQCFEPTRLYTLYVVELAGQKVLLSAEEGPDWSGSTELCS